MPIDPIKFPKLTAALAVQTRYLGDDSSNSADSSSSSDDESKKKTGRKGNMFRKLGTLAGAIYEDEKQLAAKTRKTESIRVYTFKQTEINGDKFAIEPAEVLKPPSGSPKNETVTVPFELSALWLNNTEYKTKTPIDDDTTWLVGYDIETQSYEDAGYNTVTEKIDGNTPPHCVSHQWYFNFQGVRFGFIFLTRLRISQAEFVDFLRGTVPKIKNPEILKTVKVYAHFSVYESGWMTVSPPKPKPGEAIKKPFAQLINERNDEWCDLTELRTCKIAPPTYTSTGRLCTAKPKDHSIKLKFGDSKKLQAGSLDNLGKTIGIEKKKLPDGVIKEMAKFLETNPKTFCEYAIIDSIITAEAHLYFFHKYKTCMLKPDEWDNAEDKMRMPGYSSNYFRGLYEKRYGDDWKEYLGYDDNGMMLAHQTFVHFYHGGRNDVLSVGPRGEAHYLDLHSAYLTSVVMLNDYNFSKVRVTTGSAANKRLRELYNDGPFQVVGIECSFQFKRKGKPIFPVRIDEAESLPGVRINFNTDGIIYPKSGKSNLTMPEYWVAKHNNIIEKIIVHRVIEFEKLDTHWFSDEILRLLKLRKDSNESDKLFYKNILNFFYGKTAQGVKASATAIKAHNFDRFVKVSSMTCYPLASYITGFCRATVGELLQNNECYGITTDGFITPVSRDKLVINDGDLCDQVQSKLRNGGFDKDFIGCDASGSTSLFLKTRGYLLIGRKPLKEDFDFVGPPTLKDMNKKWAEIGPPTRKDMLQKMAAMGVQVDKYNSHDPIKDFLKALQKGYADKKYFMKLNKIRADKILDFTVSPPELISNPDTVPQEKILPDVKADMTFDMKHIPISPKTEYFEWDDVKYPFTSFKTEPLDTAADFHILRALRRRDPKRDIPSALLKPTFVFTDPAEYGSEGLDDANAYFQGVDDAIKDMEHKFTATQPLTPVQAPVPQPQQPPTKQKKTKTMLINGVEQSQIIDIDIKSVIPQLREQWLISKSIPTYMEEPDYKHMLTRFDEFRNGIGSFNQLDISKTDNDDLKYDTDETEGFTDTDDFGGEE